jgi:hypothetical protein
MLTYLCSIIAACFTKQKPIINDNDHIIIDIYSDKRILDINHDMPNKRIKLR